MIRLKVRELAQARGYSMNYLSHVAILDIKVIRKMYREPTASFTTYALDKVAKALGVDASELIESVTEARDEK
jgi:DNA-binding Xre family transcriptional regulator